MKKIVVIPKEHVEYEQISGAGFDTIRFHLGTDKTLEVPETWEDLKELLCKDLKGLYKNYNVEVFDDTIFVLDSKAVLLKVYDDGEIKDSGSEVIAENRTPAQMWQIIKNLIGEE